MKNVSDKTYRENQNTNFVFNNSSPPPKILAFFWHFGKKNLVKLENPKKKM